MLDTSDSDDDAEGAHDAGLFEAVVRGFEGGLFATLVMTTFRLPIMRSLPPTANFWARFVDDEHPDEHVVPALALHFLYGAAAGTAFGLVYPRLELPLNATAETRGVVWGGLYGLLLSVFGERVMLRRLLAMEIDDDAGTVFHAGHLIYGITLGVWLESRTAGTEFEEYEAQK